MYFPDQYGLGLKNAFPRQLAQVRDVRNDSALRFFSLTSGSLAMNRHTEHWSEAGWLFLCVCFKIKMKGRFVSCKSLLLILSAFTANIYMTLLLCRLGRTG